MTEFDFRRVLILTRKCFGLDLISFRRDLKADTLQCSPLFNSARLTIRKRIYPLKTNYVNQKSTMNEIMKMYFLFEHGDFPASRVSFRAVYIDFDFKMPLLLLSVFCLASQVLP